MPAYLASMVEQEDKGIANVYAEKFLGNLRQVVEASEIPNRRLPRWLEAANIRAGYVYNTLILMVESRQGGDCFEFLGEVDSDIELLLEMPDYPGYGPGNRVQRRIREEGEFHGGTVLQSCTVEFGEGSHLIGFDYDYHGPFILLDSQIELKKNDTPIATRYVPFALYVHTDELVEPESHFQNLQKRMLESLWNLQNSPKGDEYENERQREEAILGRKSNSVIVLGNYDEDQKRDLREVRDLLEHHDYSAHLIDELPEYGGMNLRDKVRIWTTTARFCIMVDSESSGHNNEYEILREQETRLAILRPEGSGSSFMMGLEHDNRRSVFEYETTPLEVVEEAYDWAENLIEDEEDEFSEYYPWR